MMETAQFRVLMILLEKINTGITDIVHVVEEGTEDLKAALDEVPEKVAQAIDDLQGEARNG